MKCRRFMSGYIVWVGMVALCMVVPNGTAVAYSGGLGWEGDPYHIGNVADWSSLAASPGDWSAHFIMTADIDFDGADLAPVGSSATYFNGIFDGDGHVLRNGQVNVQGASPFVYVGTGGTIRDLGVEEVMVTGDYAAGLVFWNEGVILDCYATGAVSSTYDTHGVAAGLVAANKGSITACYAAGAVSGSGAGVGGLVFLNEGVILACYATGAVTLTYTSGVAGGLVAGNQGSITACYATGAVSGGGADYVGGLVGIQDPATGTVADSFWDIETSGQEGSGGGRGLTSAQMGTVYTFQNAGWSAYPWVMQDGAPPRLDWEGLGWPAIPEAGPVPLTGSGTVGDPFQIWTAADFALLSWRTCLLDKQFCLMADVDLAGTALCPVGDVEPFTGVFDGNGHVLSNVQLRQPNSTCVGVFGRLGAAGGIHNLGLAGANVTGMLAVGALVGCNEGTLTSCYTLGGAITVTGGINSGFAGGLVGKNTGGTIISCHATGTVSGDLSSSTLGGFIGAHEGGEITRCYATGPVTGGENVGGLVGSNQGGIQYAFATGPVTGTNNVGGLAGSNPGALHACFATGPVTGGQRVGGLAGDSNVVVQNCYARGAVTGTSAVGGLLGNAENSVSFFVSITDSFSTGSVTGTSAVGGLVGAYYHSLGGTPYGCFWDMESSGLSTSAAGQGRTTAEMTYPYGANTFDTWNFTDYWMEDADGSRNDGYPCLREITMPLFHPGDADRNFRIALGEAITYLAGWQQGSNPLDCAIRAAYLWQNGEAYVYDDREAPPSCWMLTP